MYNMLSKQLTYTFYIQKFTIIITSIRLYSILWNSLDQSVKDAPSSSAFKSRLKTYLFDLAYF